MALTSNGTGPAVSVVCLSPQGPSNIGAIARVMSNFGLTDLVLVAPRCSVNEEARRAACHAAGVLERCRVVASLDELDHEFHALVGTSGNPALCVAGPVESPEGVLSQVAALPPASRVGLLFGPEDHGLGNRELKRCRWVIGIPTDPDYPSMNLSHAAAALLYEWSRIRSCPATPAARPLRQPVTNGQMEALFAHLRQVLLEARFLDPRSPERILYPLRRILWRAAPDHREWRILRGITRQIGWALAQARPVESEPEQSAED